MEDFKILIKYASRGRRDRFFDGLRTIYDLCKNKAALRVLCTLDEDDTEMNNDYVEDRLSKYENLHTIYGTSTGKINAINRDFDLMPEEFKDWDIICNFSDDMRWVVYGWDEMIRADFKNISPDLSHFMAYLDTDAMGRISTLYIAGRKWFDLFGWIYDPQFISLFCDNLNEDAAKYLGKYHYTGYTIYKHLLPSYGHLPPDQLYLYQQQIGWTIDQATYNKIMDAGIDNYVKQFNL